MIPTEQREQVYGYAEQFLANAQAVHNTDPQAYLLATRGILVAAFVLSEGRLDEFRQHLSQIINCDIATVDQMFPDAATARDTKRSLFSKIMPINKFVGMPETGLDLLQGISEGQYYFTDVEYTSSADRAA